MTEAAQTPGGMVDVVFPLTGSGVPRDHAQALARSLGAALPWLASEPGVGVHPIKVVPGLEPRALLSKRARLLLRVPAGRAGALGALADAVIEVGGDRLRLGAPHTRELLAHATLYAYSVAAASDDELLFMQAVAGELEALEIRGHRVCGKRRRIAGPAGAIDSFSLMLHGLTAEHSLRLQNHGLGAHRLLGCGVFVPHKSAAAVGN